MRYTSKDCREGKCNPNRKVNFREYTVKPIRIIFLSFFLVSFITLLIVVFLLGDYQSLEQYRNLLLLISFLGIFYTIFHLHIVIGKNGKVECDNAWFDLWSIPHFLGHTIIALYFVDPVGLSFTYAVLISTSWSIIWEIIEYTNQKKYPNFACESIGNHITDIVLGFLGSLFAYFFI